LPDQKYYIHRRQAYLALCSLKWSTKIEPLKVIPTEILEERIAMIRPLLETVFIYAVNDEKELEKSGIPIGPDSERKTHCRYPPLSYHLSRVDFVREKLALKYDMIEELA
jgi:hypothetical protein